MYLAHTHRYPSYMSQILSSDSNNPRQRLRLSDSTNYDIPRTNTKSGERAFSVSGPSGGPVALVVYQVVGYYVTRECASCGIL